MTRYLSQGRQSLHALGLTALSRGNALDAENFLRRARDLEPDNPARLNDHGIALAQLGRGVEALEIFRRAARLAPQFYQAFCNLAKILIDNNRYAEAEEALSSALMLQPEYPEALNNYAYLRRCQFRIIDAVGYARRAVTIRPDYYDGWLHLGVLLVMSGDTDGALDAYGHAKILDPSRHEVHSYIFMLMNYLERFDQTDLYRKSSVWGNTFQSSGPLPASNCGVPLRIGLVSADFRNHPVGIFLAAVFEHLDRSRFGIYCYNNSTTSDFATEIIKESEVTWRDIAGLSDEKVSAIIRRDGIHLLVDLSGHTAGNRLTLFSSRPAPVQITWLGYFNTTGLPAMDWIIMDHWSIRTDEEQWFTEKVYRLPETRFCYTPPLFSPEVAPPPRRHNGYVTFGCFNNSNKYTLRVIETWSSILRRIPDSKLVLKDGTFGDPEVVQLFQKRFRDQGVEVDRIDFRSKSPHREMLQEYGDLDIVLDPFPFNGGLTTCEALWMGVPVVTMTGTTPASRQGLTFLSLLGLSDLVAQNSDGYIDRVVKLAGDINRLELLRTALRDNMAKSPLCDGVRFSRNLEKAFDYMWEEFQQRTRVNGLGSLDSFASTPGDETILTLSEDDVYTKIELNEEECFNPSGLVDLAEGFLQSGMTKEALVCLERALPLMPDSSLLFRMLGSVQAAVGRITEAEQSLEHAIDLAPGDAIAYRDLGNVMLMQQNIDDAEAYFRLSLGIDDLTETRLALVKLLRAANRIPDAESEISTLLEKEPYNIDSLCELGEIHLVSRRYSEAKDSLLQAVEIDSSSARALYSYGKYLAFVGKLGDALRSFRRALDIDPEYVTVHSSLLFIMNYMSDVTSADILMEGQRWWQMHGMQRLQSAPPIDSVEYDQNRKLRIGYVSPDLARHPVGYFLECVLPSHDRRNFEIYSYSDRILEDDLTGHLREHSDHWRVTANYTDEALFRLIRNDHIDLLIDLTGHCGRNRMTLFAMRPAPVQASWIGYPATTGLDTIDFLISDNVTIPYGEDHLFCERVIRLPETRFCYAPPPGAPQPTPPPMMNHGFITFGSFNNIAKLNRQTLTLWAELLHSLPTARLLLKWVTFADGCIQSQIADIFSELGIAPERVIYEGQTTHVEMLERYGVVDLALDPFPFSGGATTCEALWMGVPVITLLGTTPISRQTASILSCIGHPELIAESRDAYVHIIRELCVEPERLVELRSRLRFDMAASLLCDGAQFTKNLEQAFLDMWGEFCHADHSSLTPDGISDEKVESFLTSGKHSNHLDLDTWFEEAKILFSKREYDDATAIYQNILEEHPDHPRALRALGIIANLRGDNQKSIELLSLAVELKPDIIDAYLDLGKVFLEESRYSDAESVIRKAIEKDPCHPFAYNSLASVCRMTLRLGEALKLYRYSLSLGYNSIVQSNLLMDLEYDDSLSDEEVFQEHLCWGEKLGMVAESATKFPQRKPFPEKVLRIGYVSADFRNHPVGYVLLQVLPFHDKKQFLIYCYSTKADIKGDLTETLRDSSDCWRDVSKMEYSDIAEQICKDRIDILVDLSGHTGGQRLHVFADRPAPIQISWLGYWNTTGLESIDYVIYDRITLLPEYECYFVEKALFMPVSRFCFIPPWIAPDPGTPPCIEKGIVTFGCFATTAKISLNVISCWSLILKHLPSARLVLKCRSFHDEGIVKIFQESFAECGVDTNQIHFRGDSSYIKLFEEYLSIDIALDPFPFSGAATSFDALWMGVPVVTLAGHRPSGRQTLSFLKVIGLEELVAGSVDEYVEIAVKLASDKSKLSTLRAELRTRLAESPLCDGKRFTSELERLYRQVWSEWCRTADNNMNYNC